MGLFAIALHPEPDGARAFGVEKNKDVFDRLRGDAFPDGLLGLRVRERRARSGGKDLKDAEAGELGDFLGVKGGAVVLDGDRFRAFGMIPTEVFDEEIGEPEGLQVLPSGAGIEFGGHRNGAISSMPRRVGSRG